METAVAAPLFKKRSAKAKATAVRKRPATPPPDDGASDSDYSSQDEEGRQVKRHKKSLAVTASSGTGGGPPKPSTTDLEPTRFTGDRSSTIAATNDATKQSNWYDEQDELSAKSLLGTTRKAPAVNDDSSVPAADGTYKGSSGYGNFIRKNPNAPDRNFGPMKASTNVRTITTMDFAPDVCKDYKQTGFCGFGDSCKFTHMREDYKQGWELDRDWEIGNKGKQKGKVVSSATQKRNGGGEADDDLDEAELEKIPFACIICKKSYTNPIKTRCGHYFCESCALQRYRKTPACAACGEGTGGVFNGAKNLKRLLDKKRAREEKRKQEEAEAGEDAGEA